MTGIPCPRLDMGLANGLNAVPLCHQESDGKVEGRGIGGALCIPTCEVPGGIMDPEEGTDLWWP